ncbi:hypothetical protein SAY87_024850 [Trapa incisa]|uniref:Uncharacterized protein n=1 Tax=Trapa incisa TaxID=236973 RepID=A0AAN7JFQ8_9MYRT|nr:hypothetical protein SAY87_024850 [Trapa incisa]
MGDYVLCRLFSKSEEKVQVLKDDFEPATSSPIANSSPGETSWDLVYESPMSGMEMNMHPEGNDQWLTGKPGDTTTDAHMTIESSSNSCKILDVKNCTIVGPSFEGCPFPQVNTNFSDVPEDEVDCKIFSPDQLHYQEDMASYVYAPFGDDFGNDQDGLFLQDGAGAREQGISLTELLDDSFEDTTTQKKSVIESEIHDLSAGLSHSKDDVPCSDTNTEIAHVQNDKELEGFPELNQNFEQGDIYDFGDGYTQPNTFDADSSFGLFHHEVSGAEESTSQCINDFDLGTGIKIRTRQQNLPLSSYNHLSQGTAPRRLRLKMDEYVKLAISEEVGHTSESTCQSSDAVSNISEGSIREENVHNHSRTGIKIRSRLPREQQVSEESVQGTAARRIRLRLNKKSSRVCNDEEGTSDLTGDNEKEPKQVPADDETRELREKLNDGEGLAEASSASARLRSKQEGSRWSGVEARSCSRPLFLLAAQGFCMVIMVLVIALPIGMLLCHKS